MSLVSYNFSNILEKQFYDLLVQGWSEIREEADEDKDFTKIALCESIHFQEKKYIEDFERYVKKQYPVVFNDRINELMRIF